MDANTFFGRNKMILAPMVRFGTLPARLLALDYGADVVFVEEIVDRLFMRCRRVWNHRLATHDFVVKQSGSAPSVLGALGPVESNGIDGKTSLSDTNYLEDDIVFRTCPSREAPKLIFQLGTRSLENAVRVSRMLVPLEESSTPRYNLDDIQKSPKRLRSTHNGYGVGDEDTEEGPGVNVVAGIDLNMGCPKDYSLKAGIGSALIQSDSQVQVACQVLTGLVRENKPKGLYTTCKIRVLPDLTRTLELCNALQRTGIDALTVHGRTSGEKRTSSSINRTHYIREIARNSPVPVVANGGSSEINDRTSALEYTRECGASSIMLARSAMKNLSIFADQMDTRDEVVEKYLKYAVDYDMPFVNTKYCIQQMFYHDGKSEQFQHLLKTKCIRDICQLWNCENLLPAAQTLFPLITPTIAVNSIPKIFNGDCEPASSPNDTDIKVLEVHYDKRTWDTHRAIILSTKNIGGDDPDLSCDYESENGYRSFANPKLALRYWCQRFESQFPSYQTLSTTDNRSFRAIADLGPHRRFSSVRWEKSKKIAEQSAAYAALLYLLKHLLS